MSWLILIYTVGFWPALAAVAAYAWRCGGRPERAAAVMYVSATVMEIVARNLGAHPWARFDFAFVSIDMLLLAGLLILALRFGRTWSIFAVAIQLVSTLGHLMKLIYAGILPLTYAILTGSSGWLSLILLAIGTRSAQRAARWRNGSSAALRPHAGLRADMAPRKSPTP